MDSFNNTHFDLIDAQDEQWEYYKRKAEKANKQDKAQKNAEQGSASKSALQNARDSLALSSGRRPVQPPKNLARNQQTPNDGLNEVQRAIRTQPHTSSQRTRMMTPPPPTPPPKDAPSIATIHATPRSSSRPPASPLPSISRDPKTGKFVGMGHEPLASQRTTPRPSVERPRTPATPIARPGSSSSKSHVRDGSFTSIFKFGRKDSFGTPSSSSSTNASISKPQRPTSSTRTASFRETLRRASQELVKETNILRMNPQEREEFLKVETLRLRAEIEETRRLHPETRPEYQKAYIHERQRLSNASASSSTHPLDHLTRNDQFIAASRARAQLDADMQEDSRAVASILSKGEKLAFSISRVIDPLKGGKGKGKDRTWSDDSDLDFADIAPVEALHPCERCGRPETGILKEGFCGRCHKERREDWSDHEHNHSSPAEDLASEYGSSSDGSSSTPEREVNEEEYMKVAVNRRIQRVRRTIYSDPGNPFAFQERDDDASGPMAELGTSPASIMKQLDDLLRSSGQGDDEIHEDEEVKEEGGGVLLQNVVYNPNLPIAAPTPVRPGTPSLIRAHSVKEAMIAVRLESPAIAPTQEPVKEEFDDEEGESGKYVAPRSHWRKSSYPQKPLPVQGHPLPVQGQGNIRDTRFYGFYDGVLQDYQQDGDKPKG